MATVSLEAIRKSFGKTDVIHGVDIDIADGELVVLVGPSGCGQKERHVLRRIGEPRRVHVISEIAVQVVSHDGLQILVSVAF